MTPISAVAFMRRPYPGPESRANVLGMAMLELGVRAARV